jgi:co-chaperonin GroES (HSP10)
MTPLGKKILVIKETASNMKGTLYIPESGGTLEDPPYIGTIISRGPLCTDPDIIPGARVAYHWTTGIPIQIGDDSWVLLDESEITAVL